MSRGLRIVRKIGHKLQSRHWRGHGIHSPYFYQLITDVIENKNKPDGKHQLKAYHRKHKLPISHKRLLLFLRLINSFESNQILLLGAHATSITHYIHSNRKNASIQVVSECTNAEPIVADFIYLSEALNSEWVNYLLKYASNTTYIMLNGIHHSAQQASLWKSLMPHWKHSMDLFDAGLLFNRDEVPPQSIKY